MTANITYPVRYMWTRVGPFKAYGKYRGRGTIEFSDAGVRISGRHVLSVKARWGIRLALLFGYVIIMAGRFAPGYLVLFSPVYLMICLIVECVWLKEEDTLVSYSDIVNYVAKPKQCFVAIDYKGSELCAPVVLKSEKWSEIVAALRETIAERDASHMILTPSSGAAIYLAAIAFLVSYISFFSFFLRLEWVIMWSPDVWSITQLKELTLVIASGLSLLPSILFAINTHRWERQPRRADGLSLP